MLSISSLIAREKEPVRTSRARDYAARARLGLFEFPVRTAEPAQERRHINPTVERAQEARPARGFYRFYSISVRGANRRPRHVPLAYIIYRAGIPPSLRENNSGRREYQSAIRASCKPLIVSTRILKPLVIVPSRSRSVQSV